jgi:hypothetical protein
VEKREVTMILRNSEHKKEWATIFKSCHEKAKDANDKCGIKADEISFDMEENMDDKDGEHETPVRGIATAIQMRTKNAVEDSASLR